MVIYVDVVIIFASMMPKKTFLFTNKQTIVAFGISLLVCLLLSLIIPHLESEQSHIASFEKTLHQKEVAVEKLITNISKEIATTNYADIFKKQLSSYESLYNTDGFVLLIYENDSL